MNDADRDEIARFVADRNTALSSLDEAQIRAYAARWKVRMSEDPLVFWGAVHFARANLVQLPMTERTLSKRWLREHGAMKLLAQIPPEVPG